MSSFKKLSLSDIYASKPMDSLRPVQSSLPKIVGTLQSHASGGKKKRGMVPDRAKSHTSVRKKRSGFCIRCQRFVKGYPTGYCSCPKYPSWQPERLARQLTFDVRRKALRQEIRRQVTATTSSTDANDYTYYIYKGNYSELIGHSMSKRRGWRLTSEETFDCNFVWKPVSSGIRFDRFLPYHNRKMCNHFEFHHEISQKHNLYSNMRGLCHRLGLELYELLPVTFELDIDGPALNT